jgi:hypothetical protein
LVLNRQEAEEKGTMTTPPPSDFNELATELIRASAEKDFLALAETLTYLDPQCVDVAIFIRGNNAHINFVGAFRSISFPRFPHRLVSPPDIARIAQVLAEVAT